jgi:hypothetical protein
MFAPRHRVAAAELARVLRTGVRLGLCSWTPEGAQGVFFRRLAGYAPPMPDFEFDREIATAPGTRTAVR